METRVFEVRADTEKPNRITGRPIIFDSRTNLGYFDEVIDPGALDHADLSDVLLLVNHDTSGIPMARATAGDPGSTMKFSIDSRGMVIEADLDVENNSAAKNLYSAVKRGDIKGMSFMFSINGEKWDGLDTDHPTRRITSIGQVLEVSAVSFPAYKDTEISARDGKAALDAARALELEKMKAKILYNI